MSTREAQCFRIPFESSCGQPDTYDSGRPADAAFDRGTNRFACHYRHEALGHARSFPEFRGHKHRSWWVAIDAAEIASEPLALERVQPADRDALRDYWGAQIAGEGRAALSLRVVQRDGGTRTITDHGAPLLDSNVDVTVVAGVWQLEREWSADE